MSKLDKTTEDYVIRVVSKAVAKRKRRAKLDKEYLEKISRKRKMVKKLTKSASAKKAVAKKTIGKSIAKKIPYVGTAIIARDVIKGVSKATCGKRGGKWVSGKCVGTKKAKFKKGSPVKDPISKR